MNFSEFKLWRDAQLKARSPRRLDCLNPFIAMRFTAQDSRSKEARSERGLSMWTQHMGAGSHLVGDGRVQAIQGVRSALRAIFERSRQEARELWLPEDVYPFYFEAAEAHYRRAELRTFPTLPAPDLQPLFSAGPDAVALITNPISPLGRFASTDEVGKLHSWLSESASRRLVIDAVYAYRSEIDPGSRRLYETGQVYYLHSLSKAWLERGVFGAALLPRDEGAGNGPRFDPPSEEAGRAAANALLRQPDHPQVQQALFKREWARLAPGITAMLEGDFRPPQNGYLAPVAINHRVALERHDTMLVPASVFGSRDPNLSIASCLYDMKSRYFREESV